MNDNQDANTAMIKVLLAWLGMITGGITLSDLVLGATLIYTVLQIGVLLGRIIKGKE